MFEVGSIHARASVGSDQFGCRASRLEKSRFQGCYVFTESSVPLRSSENPETDLLLTGDAAA